MKNYALSVERRVALAGVQGPELESAISQAKKRSSRSGALATLLGIAAGQFLILAGFVGALGRSAPVVSEPLQKPIAGRENPSDFVDLLRDSIRGFGVENSQDVMYGDMAASGLGAIAASVSSQRRSRLPRAYGREAAAYKMALEDLMDFGISSEVASRRVADEASVILASRSLDGALDQALSAAIADPPPVTRGIAM